MRLASCFVVGVGVSGLGLLQVVVLESVVIALSYYLSRFTARIPHQTSLTISSISQSPAISFGAFFCFICGLTGDDYFLNGARCVRLN